MKFLITQYKISKHWLDPQFWYDPPIYIVSDMINAGANVNARSSFGCPVLHMACMGRNADAVKMLVAAGADVNSSSDCHINSLHCCLERGRFYPMSSVVSFLIDKGANIYVKSQEGNTLLCHAIGMCPRHLDVIQKIIEHGADVNATGQYDLPPINLAVAEDFHYDSRGRNHLAEMLAEAGASCEIRYHDKSTLLFELCKRNVRNTTTIESIILAGVDVNAKNIQGLTALMIASERHSANVVSLLLEHGADASLCDNIGRNALMYAVSGKHSVHASDLDSTIYLLLSAGCVFLRHREGAKHDFYKSLLEVDLFDNFSMRALISAGFATGLIKYPGLNLVLSKHCIVGKTFETVTSRKYFCDDKSLGKLLFMRQKISDIYGEIVAWSYFWCDDKADKPNPERFASIEEAISGASLVYKFAD